MTGKINAYFMNHEKMENQFPAHGEILNHD